MKTETIELLSNLYRCNCMNDGSNTEEKHHEPSCSYVLWLNLQNVMNNKEAGISDETIDTGPQSIGKTLTEDG